MINNENIERFRNVVHADRKLRVEKIASEIDMSVGICNSIIHIELHMHRYCQHMVAKMLSSGKKETRLTLAGGLITIVDQEINTGDETFFFVQSSDKTSDL